MGKLGDLWVKLGLKSEEFDKGMKDAEGKVEGFGGKFPKMKAKAVAAFAAIGAAVVKMAGEFIHHSQRIGDAWNQNVAGMTGAWKTFLTALTNTDFNGLIGRMGSAFDAAKKSAAAHDAEFEVENAINIRKAQMQDELAQLQIIARSTDRTYEERADAVAAYLAKVKPLYDQEIALRDSIRNADLNEYLSNANLGKTTENRALLERFLTEVAPNGTLLNALDNYTKRNTGKDYKLSADDERMLDAFFAQYDIRSGGVLAALATYYQGSNDETASKATDAIIRAYAAEAAFNEETKRMQTMLAGFGGKIDTGGAPSTGGAIPANATENLAEVIAADEAMADALEEAYDQYKKFHDLGPLQLFDNDLWYLWEENLQNLTNEMKKAESEAENLQKALGEEFVEALTSGAVAGFNALADAIAGVDGADAAAVMKSLLSPIADMAISLGTMTMLSGEAIEKLKESLATFAGGSAIAAGAALVGIGVAMKAGLSAMAKSGAGASSTTSASVADMGRGDAVSRSELVVTVNGIVKGNDIIISGQNTVKALSR